MFSLWTYIMLKPKRRYTRDRGRGMEKRTGDAQRYGEKDSGRRGRQIGCLTAVGPCSAGSPACTVHPVVRKYARHCLMVHTCYKSQMNWPRQVHVSSAAGREWRNTARHQTLTALRSWNRYTAVFVSGEQVTSKKKVSRREDKTIIHERLRSESRLFEMTATSSTIERRECDCSIKCNGKYWFYQERRGRTLWNRQKFNNVPQKKLWNIAFELQFKMSSRWLRGWLDCFQLSNCHGLLYGEY